MTLVYPHLKHNVDIDYTSMNDKAHEFECQCQRWLIEHEYECGKDYFKTNDGGYRFANGGLEIAFRLALIN